MPKGFLPSKKEWSEGWKKWLVGAIILLVVTKSEYFYDMIQFGEETKKNTEIKNLIKDELRYHTTGDGSHDFMDSLMNSKYMNSYKIVQQQKLITYVMNSEDSTRLKMSAKLAQKTGMNIDAMIDTLAVMIVRNNKGEKYLTKKDAIPLIRQYCWRPEATF